MVGNVLTPAHLLILLTVALIVLGPKRLPAAGRGLGEAMRGFKDALTSDNRSETPGPQISEAATSGWQSSSPASTSSPSTPTPTGELEDLSCSSSRSHSPSAPAGRELPRS